MTVDAVSGADATAAAEGSPHLLGFGAAEGWLR